MVGSADSLARREVEQCILRPELGTDLGIDLGIGLGIGSDRKQLERC
jgi:hypothetical protein